jgi:hypothetical protein
MKSTEIMTIRKMIVLVPLSIGLPKIANLPKYIVRQYMTTTSQNHPKVMQIAMELSAKLINSFSSIQGTKLWTQTIQVLQ